MNQISAFSLGNPAYSSGQGVRSSSATRNASATDAISSPFSVSPVGDSYTLQANSSVTAQRYAASLQFGRANSANNPFVAAMAILAQSEQERLEREKRKKLQKQQEDQQNDRQKETQEETRYITYQGKPLDLSDPIKKLRQQIAGLEAKKRGLEMTDPERMAPVKKEEAMVRVQGQKIKLEAILKKLEEANGKLPPKIKIAIKVPASGGKSK